ncbi:MAG: hypothetical protein ABSH26_07600 [Opitutaceae bacterium]
MAIPPITPKGQPRAHKRTDLLLAVLLTLLGAAVFAIAILAATIEKRNETIRQLREKTDGSVGAHSLFYFSTHGGNLPIIATSRRSLSGSGFVLTLRNESTEELTLAIALDNPASRRQKLVNVTLGPEQTAEFGHFDEWKLAAGDVVAVSHEGFNPVTMRF